MNSNIYRTLFYTVSFSWVLFFAWNVFTNSNQRYYPIPLADVRYDSDKSEEGRYFESLPGAASLREEGVEVLYFTEVPIATYRPIYGPMVVTGLSLLFSFVISRKKQPEEASQAN